MTVLQEGLQVGGLTLHPFGLIVGMAVLAGTGVAAWRVGQRGGDAAHVPTLAFWMVVLALIVGRVFFILDPAPSVARFYDRGWYLSHLFDMQVGPLAVWSGGLGGAGVAVGALLAFALAARRRGWDAAPWADRLLPGVLAAMTLAPWANLVNRQMLGPSTSLPWGIAVDGRVVHPTPVYASLWMGLALLSVLLLERGPARSWPAGRLAVAGLMAAAAGVLVLGFLHVDASRALLGLSGMQRLAVIVLVFGGLSRWVISTR